MTIRHGCWRWLNGSAGSVFRLTVVIALLAAFAPIGHTPRPAQAQPGTAICNSVTGIPNAECQALMALFAATNGPAWTNNTGWGQTTTPCTWFGVGCSPGGVVSSTVTSLQLPANGLAGTLPISFFSLPNLQVLYLYENRLTGGLPAELGNLSNLVDLRVQGNLLDGPISFDPSRLARLREFIGSRNQITGTLPVFTNMPSLVNLDLSDNALTGTLEGRFVNLPSLGYLSLGNTTAQGRNQLSGPIPPQIGSLPSLTTLWLFGNRLTGGLPAELGNLSNLVDLRVQGNLLDGPISFDPARLTRLREFIGSRNQITGTLPVFTDMPSLVNLDLSDNALTGTLEGRFVNLPSLAYLNLGNNTDQGRNQLSGPIPPQIGSLPSLTTLWLFGNRLTGGLPAELGNLSNLVDLRVQGNLLDGPISFDPARLTRLREFYASRNQITGTLPVFTNMPSLVNLSLSDNALTGTLEGRFVNLPSLQVLYLYNNRLTGPVPPEIGALAALDILRLDGNGLTGPIPSTIGRLTRLRELSLYDNQLTGPIPVEIGNMTSLQGLHLRSNLLEGNLPDSLNRLVNLGELEVYQNRLTGSIPDLSNLQRLSSLRLDSNRLTGTIPPTLGALSNLGTLYLAGNRLTGPIPKELGELTNLRSLSLDNNALEGDIPAEFAKIGSTLREISPTLASVYSANYNNLSTSVTPGVNWLLRRYNPLRGTYIWQETQTRPPDNVRARQIGGNLLVTWDALPLQLTNYQVNCDGPQPQTHTTPYRNRTITSHPFPNVAQGTYTCTVRTFVEVQNTTQQNALLSAPSAPAVITVGALPSNRVFVQNSARQPVIGASVVVSRAGAAREQAVSVAPLGEVAFNQPVQLGDALIAISQTASITTPKGPQPNLVTRGYVTNLDITPEGAMPYSVATTGTHALTVTASNPLLLFDLVVSMQWSAYENDATKRYEVLRELERAFREASNHFYDVSDGRVALGSVKIFDDGQFWQDADIHVFANTSLIPNAEVSGTRRLDAYLNIRRGWDRKQADIALDANDGYKMLVHELGHYLLGMRDSYEGDSTVMCTTLMAWPYDGEESGIFSMQGLAPWLPGTAEAQRCAKTEQWASFGVSDWETIVANFGNDVGVTGMTVPTRHITATTIASPLSATKVVTFPSGRQIQAVAVRLLTLTPAIPNANAIGQPLNATILRPNGQIIDLGPVDRNGNITVTVPFESNDQLLLSTPDGATTKLLSAAELSGTVAISVSDALANPTIDIGVGDGARSITITVGNVTALEGASTLTATVVESGNEDPFKGVLTLTRQTDVYVGSLNFGSRGIKQGDVQVIARAIVGVPVRLVTSFTTDGDGGSHMVGRVPRSPDGKFEMRIPFEAAQLLQNNAFVVSPIRITKQSTDTMAAMSSNLATMSDPYLAPPPGLKQIGSLFNIRASQGLVSIAEPMSATLYYDPATLGNLSETQIKIYYLNEQANPKQWEPLPTTLNLRSTVETHSVSATTFRFGIYGLFIKTRYLLQGGEAGPRQNEYVYVRNTAEPLLTTLAGNCTGTYIAVYSFDNFNPQNPWRKFIADARPEEAYLNTLSESTPGQAYQIVMKQGTTCRLDFTSGPDPDPGPDPLTLPIVPATAYGRVRDDATEIIGRCSDDPQAQPVKVAPTVDERGRRVFNIDLPVSTREAVTCTLEAKAAGVTITKQITAQSGTRQPVDMSAYNWFFPWIGYEPR